MILVRFSKPPMIRSTASKSLGEWPVTALPCSIQCRFIAHIGNVGPTRAHEGLVQNIRTVSRREDDDSAVGAEAIHLCEELIEGVSLSSFEPMLAFLPRARPMASISSMKTMAGAFSFACLNKSRTRDAPTPTNISTKSDPLNEKNGT